MKGIKHDQDKDRWDLLPLGTIEEVVQVLTYAAKERGDNNWRYVKPFYPRFIAATFRHIKDWILHEKIDKKSGKSHLAHAICNLIFLNEGPARENASTKKITEDELEDIIEGETNEKDREVAEAQEQPLSYCWRREDDVKF
jgi:hypothetical protein